MNQVSPSQAQPLLVNDWNTGLCSCSEDLDSCREVLCCWHAQLSAQYGMAYHDEAGVRPCSCCWLAIGDMLLLGIPSAICVCSLRGGIGSKYMLIQTDEDACRETCLLLTSYFCCMCFCMQCQNHREMSIRGDYPGGCTTEVNPLVIRPKPVSPMGAPQQMVQMVMMPMPMMVAQGSYVPSPGSPQVQMVAYPQQQMVFSPNQQQHQQVTTYPGSQVQMMAYPQQQYTQQYPHQQYPQALPVAGTPIYQ